MAKRIVTEETRAKMSESAKRRWAGRREKATSTPALMYEGDDPVTLTANEFRELLGYMNVIFGNRHLAEIVRGMGSRASAR